MSRIPVWPRAMVAVIATVLAFGACDSTPPPPSGAAVPTEIPGHSPGASSAASPASDVSAAFQAAYADIDSGLISLEGTITIGEVQAQLSGTSTFNGPDSLDTATTTVGGVASTVQRTKVAGIRYVKTGDGPWLQSTSIPPPGFDDELSEAATTVTDAGIETRAGQAVHRLVPADQDFDPAVFGMGADDATDATTTLTFYATDDGTPVAVTLEMTWTQPQGDGTVEGALSLEFTLSELGERQSIARPASVWATFKSKRWKFRLAYPDDYDTSKNKAYDLFIGPNGELAGAGRFAASSISLNEWVSLSETFFKDEYDSKSFKSEAATLAGVRARLISVRGTLDGRKIILYDILSVKGGYLYEVYWLVYARNGPDDSVFQQIVSTFAFK